jgi:histidinol-phosphate aminotransferase
LQRQKVIVRPVDPYGLPEYIRVTVGTPAENEAFIAALKKVLAE